MTFTHITYKIRYNKLGDGMNRKQMIIGFSVILVVMIGIFSMTFKPKTKEVQKIEGTILARMNDEVTIESKNKSIYTIKMDDVDADAGDHIILSYTGVIDDSLNLQKISIIDYKISPVSTDKDGIPKDWLDDGIFSDYYVMAYNQLQKLTLDEKIGQLFLVRYPNDNTKAINDLKTYKLGGYLFFEVDFKDKTKDEVIHMMDSLQKNTTIPLLTAVDEEGGKVVRVSSNPNLAPAKFKSSRELYQQGGFDLIRKDTLEKSNLLNNLGLNLNLAPVVDVSTNASDYMYPRTIGENTKITSEYAKTVILASKENKVSYTLKHFPGYGNNSDTHTGSSVDNRRYDEIQKNDLPPFKAGIEAGAESILISHNTVNSIDNMNPASLSSTVHNILRKELGFTGIIITDDLAMGAVSSIDNATVKALLAGNDLIITTDYIEGINEVKKALNNGTLSEELIDKLAFRILAWKHYKGLMYTK